MNAPPLVLAIGLAFVSVYPDLAGHGSAFAASNALIETQFGINGRLAFSCGLFLFSLLMMLFPYKAQRHERGLCAAFSAASIGAIAVYTSATLFSGQISGYMAILGAFSIGFTYGWVETYLLLLLFHMNDYTLMIWTLLASFVLKCCSTRLTSTLDATMQMAILFATPVVIFVCTKIIEWKSAHGCYDSEPFLRLPQTTNLDKRFLLVALIACSAIQSVARGMSILGFWGMRNLYNGNDLWPFFLITVGFLIVSRVVFLWGGGKRVDLMLVMGFIVLASGLLLSELLRTSSLGISSEVTGSVAELTELYSHAFWLVTIILTVRETHIHPYRVTGLAEVVLSFTAIVLSVPLRGLSDFGRMAVMVSIYLIAVVLLFMFFLFGQRMPEQTPEVVVAVPVGTSDAGLKALAASRNLSPRETDVFLLLARGRSRKVITETLYMSESTVKTHTENIYRKFGVHNKQDLIAITSKVVDQLEPAER